MTKDQLSNLLILILVVFVAYGLAFIFPWRQINWGQISLTPGNTVTVTGSASGTTANQVASFTAGVSAANDEKQTALEEVDEQINQVISAVKEFGIPEEDIKTQNVSVYREENYLPERNRSEPGQWRVSNNIEIKLRDIDRATELSNLLATTPATNIYGPNLSVEDTTAEQTELIGEAIKNARTKAEAIAKGSGAKLGKVISVQEMGTQTPGIYRIEALGGGGGAGPIEPGTSEVSKSVTVTFELIN